MCGDMRHKCREEHNVNSGDIRTLSSLFFLSNALLGCGENFHSKRMGYGNVSAGVSTFRRKDYVTGNWYLAWIIFFTKMGQKVFGPSNRWVNNGSLDFYCHEVKSRHVRHILRWKWKKKKNRLVRTLGLFLSPTRESGRSHNWKAYVEYFTERRYR